MNIKVSITLDVNNSNDEMTLGEMTTAVEFVLQRAHLGIRIAEQLDGIAPCIGGTDIGFRVVEEGESDG